MSVESQSPQSPARALFSKRQNRDLAPLLVRLDMLECSLEKNLTFVLETLLDISRAQNAQLLAPQPASKKRDVARHGACRIIQFQPAGNLEENSNAKA